MSAKKKTKRKSPKILLEKKKVFILTSSIVILCILLLFINAFFGSEPRPVEPAAPQKDVQEEKSVNAEKKEVLAQSVKNTPLPPKPVTGSSAKPAGKTSKTVDKKTPEKIQEKNIPYDIPKAEEGSTLVFIIDDAGHSVENLKKYTSLPFPITLAVLPGVAETKECAELIVQSKKELMLHQPMQAENLSVNPGPGAITPNMTLGEIKAKVRENLSLLGTGVKGMNNHEGSLITEDEVRIGAVLDAAIECGVYFIDSRTTSLTKAESAAAVRGITIRHRDIFIDNIIEKKEMAAQIYHGLALANKNGTVIMIGHVDKSAGILPDLLRDMYPYLIKKGYKFAFPSQLK
ncbi:MAG: divergent polysaccharide deacetylase family protein [Treponema sp.]|nr:divergent polysaccharide deacetylase family protein [Treponema sp.]